LVEDDPRESARRRLAELSRELRESPVADGAADADAADGASAPVPSDSWRRRMGVTCLVVAGALFVSGWAFLAMSPSRGTFDTVSCGTALNNPGWHDGHPCYDAVKQTATFGWLLVAAAVPVALTAATYRWGSSWWSPRAVSPGEPVG